MGMSLTGIHVFGTAAPEDAELPFRSFSAGWFTCVNDFSETDPERTYEARAAHFPRDGCAGPVFQRI